MLYNDSVFRIKAYGNMTLHQVYKQTLDKFFTLHVAYRCEKWCIDIAFAIRMINAIQS